MRDIKNNRSHQTSQTLEDNWNKFNYQLLQSLFLCASSVVSTAIVLSGSVALAEAKLPASGASQKTISELNTSLHSNPSNKNATIANSNQIAPKQEPHHAPVQASPTPLKEPAHSTQTLKQAARSSPEIPIESTKPNSFDHLVQAPIAQSDASAPEPSESSSNATSSDDWRFSVEPYFFVPFDVRGDVTAAGRSASIDLGFDDILNLDRAFDAGLRFEVQHNRLGFILDAFYIFAGQSGSVGVTLPEGSLQRFGIGTAARVEGDASLFVRELTIDTAVSYRVVDTVLGNSRSSNPYPRLAVAPILGLRTRFLTQEVEVDTVHLGNFSLPVDQEFNSSNTTIEPLVGAQIGLDLSKRWTINARGDVSGFDINADEDSTWNLFVGTQYHISPNVSLQLAYRFNGFDFEDGEGLSRTRVNLYQNGLWLSGIFRF